MKNIGFFILFMVAGISAAMGQSMMKVSTADRSVINVSVDGRYFNKSGSSVTVGDLPGGKHFLQIYAITQDRRGRAREEVIYEGKVRTSNGQITLVVFDDNTGLADIRQDDMTNYAANNPQPAPGGNYNNNYPGNNNNDQNNGNYNNNNAPVASPIAQGTLTDDKVSSLKAAVAAKDADLQKMNVLKDGLKNETFTTDQVSTMMGWFVFEETKVSFAEWAYSNTVDKNDYKSLENQFSYKNSQDELDKFLQGQK